MPRAMEQYQHGKLRDFERPLRLCKRQRAELWNLAEKLYDQHKHVQI